MHWQFFPDAMTTQDLQVMRLAVRWAAEIEDGVFESEDAAGNALAGAASEADMQVMALIIYRYYAKGLSDPARLAHIARFLASSRVFREQASAQMQRSAHPGA